MPSIQSSGYPLSFKVEGDPFSIPAESNERWVAIRTAVRALEGMQKEAVVSLGAAGGAWRMVSDEGPYLNGSDLAPFPLAFFTAGMQFSLMSRLLRLARARGAALRSLRSEQDNTYSMDGSFLRGDARGGAMPAEVLLRIESEASVSVIAELVRLAATGDPADSVMRVPLQNTFALSLNGRDVSLTDVRACTGHALESPRVGFETVRPRAESAYRSEIIRKLATAEAVHGVEGGAGSSLQAEQKRTLHVRGEAWLGEGLLMETTIRLFKPIGSTFHLVCDELPEVGGRGQAPPPLAYLAAGAGFCYMTQLGRYAHIVRQRLDSYAVVQDNAFTVEGAAAEASGRSRAEPFDTHVFLESPHSEEDARRLVTMGERTCFLHAAMRGSHPTKIRAELNGSELI